MCAHVRTCAMCVQKGFQSVRAMCVRVADLRCVTCESNFARFWVIKGLILDCFGQNLPQSYPFAINVHVRVRNEFWAKRTRACDVQAAENRVCECACVRGKKSSQLTVC